MRWLKSATITLLPDNKTVSVLCDLNKSSPPVKCFVIVNCTTCKSVTSKVFAAGSTEKKVTPGNDYYISVQAVSTDTERPVEDYSVRKSLSIPRPTHTPNNGSSSKFIIVPQLVPKAPSIPTRF